MFSLCPPPEGGGGGSTPSPSQSTPTGPMSFLGAQCLVPGPFAGKVPQSQMGGGTPVLAKRWEVPKSQVGVSQDGVPLPARTGWGTPTRLGWGTPNQDRMGYPQPGQDGVTPPPPPNRVCLDRLCCGRYTSCGFPQENCLV